MEYKGKYEVRIRMWYTFCSKVYLECRIVFIFLTSSSDEDDEEELLLLSSLVEENELDEDELEDTCMKKEYCIFVYEKRILYIRVIPIKTEITFFSRLHLNCFFFISDSFLSGTGFRGCMGSTI